MSYLLEWIRLIYVVLPGLFLLADITFLLTVLLLVFFVLIFLRQYQSQLGLNDLLILLIESYDALIIL